MKDPKETETESQARPQAICPAWSSRLVSLGLLLTMREKEIKKANESQADEDNHSSS